MTFITKEAHELAKLVAKILIAKKQTIAVSESCCGGLIASYLVSVPGASQFFVGGTTTYSLESRLILSGWSEEDVKNYTGPSEEVAKRLARNLRLELGSTYTLAETGWADGPNGGQVFFAVCTPEKNIGIEVETGSDDRIHNMEVVALMALKILLQIIG